MWLMSGQFRVGACLLDASGEYFQGANIENAAFSGICAERTALVKAMTSRPNYEAKFAAVGVAADTADFCSPCGSGWPGQYLD